MSTIKHILLTFTLALSAVSLPAAAVECHEQPNGEMLCDGKVFVQPAETQASAVPAALEVLQFDADDALPSASAASASTPATQSAPTPTAVEARAAADEEFKNIQYEKYVAMLLLFLGVVCFAVALGQQSAGAAVLGCLFVSIGIAIDMSHEDRHPEKQDGAVSVRRNL